ncbi:MAG: hypothetical protein HY075_10545, partial [Deltaproteobacteria bacterium]|nr:hypothetical protein [Deltaproteobacteria bacterium]
MNKDTHWLLRAFLGYKLAVFAVALVALMAFAGIQPESVSHFVSLLYEWDAKHILRVAREGYLAAEPSIQVYPVFPLLIRAFHVVVPSWEWAGVLAAQAGSFFGFLYFYRLARLELDEKTAKLALALFAFFPTAYFLSVTYTETAFCALSFGAVYQLRRERFAPAAALAFLAALTRVNGARLHVRGDRHAALAFQARAGLRSDLRRLESADARVAELLAVAAAVRPDPLSAVSRGGSAARQAAARARPLAFRFSHAFRH